MKAVSIAFLALLAGCASAPASAPPPTVEAEVPLSAVRTELPAPPEPTPTRQVIACPPLPTLPARPTPLQRQIHFETIVAQYVRCAGR